MPAISILIPAHNREAYLEEAVRSVMNQTFSDIEIIIVNDASTDGTGALADTLAQEDSRIRVIHHTENKLRSGALNTGIDHAKGAYIGFLDSDDFYVHDKLERQFAFLEANPHIDGVYGDYESKTDNSEKLYFNKAIPSTDDVREQIIARTNGGNDKVMSTGYIPSCSPLIRARVFEKIRFDTSLRNAEDFDMWLQILGAGFVLKKLDGGTYVYRHHANQKSRNPERMKIALAHIDEKINTGAYLRQ